MRTHGKAYGTVEELKLRRSVFTANVARIEQHNSEGHEWTLAVNRFADLTWDEFKARRASGYR